MPIAVTMTYVGGYRLIARKYGHTYLAAPTGWLSRLASSTPVVEVYSIHLRRA